MAKAPHWRPHRTINLEPHWSGVYRYLRHIEATNREAFKSLIRKIGREDWDKIKALAAAAK